MELERVVQYFDRVREDGLGYKALCPAHPDKNPSLSIYINKDNPNKIVLKCFAGCDGEEIAQAAGLTINNLYINEAQGNSGIIQSSPMPPKFKPEIEKKPPYKIDWSKTKILAKWPYYNIDGSLYAEKIKQHTVFLPPYDIKEEEIEKDYRTIYYKDGQKIKKKHDYDVPYNLLEVLKSDIICLVEGEKDCETLRQASYVATTSIYGASKSDQKHKWPDNNIFNQYFGGKEVLVFPDNDDPGYAHMNAAIEHIQFYNKDNPPKIKLIILPGLPEKGDITDWFNMGHTIEELRDIIASAPYLNEKKTDDNIESQPRKIYNFTDLGNKERFLAKYSTDIRYCVEWKRWLIWNGKQWEIDNKGAIYILAQQCVRDITKEAEEAATTKEFKAIMKHAKDSESKQKIMNMVELAKYDPAIAISASDIDADIWLLGCKNGIVNLKTNELMPFSRDILVTKFGGAIYNKNAQCPLWEEFLLSIFPRPESQLEYIQYVQRAVGYTLTGDIKEQILFLMWGEKGGNGKGTFLNIIQKLMGDYAFMMNPDVLVSKTSDYIKLGEQGLLQGARFARASESDQGAVLNEDMIKRITSSQQITGKFMNENSFRFMPTHKLWFETNHLPKLRGGDGGTERRLKRIDFNAKFDEKLGNRDENIEEKLTKELDGIFQWALDGLALYREFGMMEPEVVTTAIKEYMDEMDAVQVFMKETCEIVDNPNVSLQSSRLYELYEKWCKENGEERFKLTHKGFCARLRLKHYADKKVCGQLHWQGVQLT